MNVTDRRSHLWENTPAELSIRKAIDEVESLEADVNLTDAVIKLLDTFNLVADFVDTHKT